MNENKEVAMASVSISADPQAVLDFVKKLASDDTFRADLEKDPGKILSQSGIVISPMPANIKLPPKNIFADAIKNASATGVSPQVSPHWAFLAFFAFM